MQFHLQIYTCDHDDRPIDSLGTLIDRTFHKTVLIFPDQLKNYTHLKQNKIICLLKYALCISISIYLRMNVAHEHFFVTG